MKKYMVEYVVIKSAIYAEVRQHFLNAENLNDVIKNLDKYEKMRYYITKIFEETETGSLVLTTKKIK